MQHIFVLLTEPPYIPIYYPDIHLFQNKNDNFYYQYAQFYYQNTIIFLISPHLFKYFKGNIYENFDLLLLFTIIISNSNAYFWLKGNFMPTNTNATMWRDWC